MIIMATLMGRIVASHLQGFGFEFHHLINCTAFVQIIPLICSAGLRQEKMIGALCLCCHTVLRLACALFSS